MLKKTKICLICSVGGHFHQLQMAVKDVPGEKYWVTYKTKHTAQILENESHYFISNLIYKRKITYAINLFQSLYHLLKEKPDVVISTGAGVAVPTIYLAKKIFKTKIIYICSAANVVEPSRTPIWAYPYADLFLVQWDSLCETFPKAINIGVL